VTLRHLLSIPPHTAQMVGYTLSEFNAEYQDAFREAVTAAMNNLKQNNSLLVIAPENVGAYALLKKEPRIPAKEPCMDCINNLKHKNSQFVVAPRTLVRER